jgi:DNA-binding MarR family transcriptional regulator
MDISALIDFRRILRKLEREIELQTRFGGQCCGVTLAQCHLLMELGLLGSTNLGALAQELQLDKSTLSRTVDGLVKLGLVQRDIADDDRRFADLSLTEAGASYYAAISDTCNGFYLQVFDRLPQERHTEIIEALSLFVQAIMKVREAGLTVCCQPPDEKEVVS